MLARGGSRIRGHEPEDAASHVRRSNTSNMRKPKSPRASEFFVRTSDQAAKMASSNAKKFSKANPSSLHLRLMASAGTSSHNLTRQARAQAATRLIP